MKKFFSLKSMRLPAAALILGALSVTAFAQPGPAGGPRRGAGGFIREAANGPAAGAIRERARQRLGVDAAFRFGLDALVSPQAINRLKLTDDQVAKLKKIESDAERASIDLEANVSKARFDLREAMEQDAPDKSGVLSLIEKAGKAEVDLRKDQASRLLNARDVLTAAQRKDMKNWMDRRPGFDGERGGRGGFEGNGPRPRGGDAPFRGGRGMKHGNGPAAAPGSDAPAPGAAPDQAKPAGMGPRDGAAMNAQIGPQVEPMLTDWQGPFEASGHPDSAPSHERL